MSRTKEIEIKVEGTEWEEAMDKAYEKANQKVKIDGFRPGKAPKDVFLKKYGKESLFMDAADIVIEKAYGQMLEDNKDVVTELVARPDIELKSIDEKAVEFKFVLTLKPEVKLGKYKNLDVISKRNEKLHNIGHKVYYDFQINAFLFCEDIYNYSTIHEVPEFIFSLSSLNDETNELYIKWKSMCEPYVVKYKAKIKDFTYFTFYDSEMEYENDRQDNWKRLRKLLISRSIESMFSRSSSEIYAYMAPDTVVSGENIIEYIPAEEWRKNVLKYFGKK